MNCQTDQRQVPLSCVGGRRVCCFQFGSTMHQGASWNVSSSPCVAWLLDPTYGSRVYKVFDLKNYNILYEIRDRNIQEIKIR